MKKIAVLFLLLTICLSLISCVSDSNKENTPDNNNNVDNNNNSNSNNNNNNDGIDDGAGNNNNNTSDESNKLEGTIAAISILNDGIALAKTSTESNILYGIDTDLNILFTLNVDTPITPLNLIRFENGLARISDTMFCDKNGNIIKAEDLGVTSFPYDLYYTTYYHEWLKDGYIIAEIDESTYASSVKKLGLLNTKFEWIIEPCEEMYDLLKGDDIRKQEYLANGYFYIERYDSTTYSITKNYLNITTLETTDKLSFEIPSKNWKAYMGNTAYFTDYNENIVLELKYPNISAITRYEYGACVVEYYNAETQKKYFNLVNEKGEFLFDPIEIDINVNAISGYRSENMIVIEESYKTFATYDLKGNLLGRITEEELNSDKYNYFISCVNEDTIVFCGIRYSMNVYETKYRMFDKYLNEID